MKTQINREGFKELCKKVKQKKIVDYFNNPLGIANLYPLSHSIH